LIVAEHDHASLKSATLNTITAARKLGSDVHVLVAGHQAGSAAQAAAQVDGVAKVMHADAPHLAGHTAENLAAVVIAVAGPAASPYSRILLTATSFGKNAAPRIPAL